MLRERLLAVLRGEIPDCVPCDPDISNMVPCRLTGKPFWDIYVYQDPPLWKAYIEAIKHFDLDGGFELYDLGGDVLEASAPGWERRIVTRRKDGSFATQDYYPDSDTWSRHVLVHTADNPPATNVLPEKLGLPAVPSEWEGITGVKQWPAGMELWDLVRRELGNQGILGLSSGASTVMLGGPEDIYSFYDDPKPWRERARRAIRYVEARMEKIAGMKPRPDLLLCGGSGTLVWQTPAIFRELALPVLKRATELAYDLGIPTHVHSCGPDRAGGNGGRGDAAHGDRSPGGPPHGGLQSGRAQAEVRQQDRAEGESAHHRGHAARLS